jgi:hypothetical protein
MTTAQVDTLSVYVQERGKDNIVPLNYQAIRFKVHWNDALRLWAPRQSDNTTYH